MFLSPLNFDDSKCNIVVVTTITLYTPQKNVLCHFCAKLFFTVNKNIFGIVGHILCQVFCQVLCYSVRNYNYIGSNEPLRVFSNDGAI